MEEKTIEQKIRGDIQWAIGYVDDTDFGYRIKGDEWWAEEYDDADNVIATYKLTLKVEVVF